MNDAPLLIDERYEAEATSATRTELKIAVIEGARSLVFVDGPLDPVTLPEGALEAVFGRIGRELAPDVACKGPTLDCGSNARIWRFRHKDAFDVIARDWLAFDGGDGRGPPRAALAVTIAGALRHLARALRAPA